MYMWIPQRKEMAEGLEWVQRCRGEAMSHVEGAGEAGG